MEAIEDQWKRGDEVSLAELGVQEFKTGEMILVTECYYFTAPIKVAGLIKKVELIGGETYVYLQLTGTSSEGLLTAHSRDPDRYLCLQVCQSKDSKEETGDFLAQGVRGKRSLPGREPEDWATNLEAVRREGGRERDELVDLRRRGEGLGPAPAVPGVGHVDLVEEVEPENKESKKKKKKKEKKSKKERSAEKKKLSGKNPLSACGKDPQALFEGTGLDCKEKVRNRVLKKAKRYVSKKGRVESSSSGSSSSSSSSATEGSFQPEGLFAESSRARGVYERYPGILTQEALKTMRGYLLTEAGESLEDRGHRPIALLYFRQQLQKKCSGPVHRELLTLSTALDLVLRGRASQASDVLAQRIKSLEAVLYGTHWQVAQRMEVCQPDQATVAHRLELQQAQKENYQDARTTYLGKLPGKGGDYKGKDAKGEKGDRKGGKKGGDEKGRGKQQDGGKKAEGKS